MARCLTIFLRFDAHGQESAAVEVGVPRREEPLLAVTLSRTEWETLPLTWTDRCACGAKAEMPLALAQSLTARRAPFFWPVASALYRKSGVTVLREHVKSWLVTPGPATEFALAPPQKGAWKLFVSV